MSRKYPLPEDDVIERFKSGATGNSIAKQFGVPEHAVVNLLRKHGVRRDNRKPRAPNTGTSRARSELGEFTILEYKWGMKLLFTSDAKHQRVLRMLKRCGGEVV